MAEDDRFNGDENPYIFKIQPASESPKIESPNRIDELRAMRQEALSAMNVLEVYLGQTDALITPKELEALKNVLSNVPLREGNLFFSDPDRKNRFEKSAAIVPEGDALDKPETRVSVRSALREYATQLALPNQPESFAARVYAEYLGDKPLEAGETVILDVDALYGKDVAMPSALVFANTSSKTPVGGSQDFASTAYVVNEVIQELASEYQVLSFPPLNARADTTALSYPESLLAFSIGVLRATRDLKFKDGLQADDSKATLFELDLIELVVSTENFKKFKDYRTLLQELLQQKIERSRQ